jgi:hypothetical protein
VVAAIVATAAIAYLLLPLAAWAVVRGLTLVVNGSIWAAASFSSGADGWTIAGTIVQAAAGAFATPEVSATVIALVAVGALALFGLQRLLGSEEDPSQ